MSAEDLNNDDDFTSKDVHSVSFAFERRNDHCSFSLRGLEVNYVIVCITKEPYSFSNLSADLKIYEVKYVVARLAKYGPLSFTPSNTIKSIFQKTCKQWEDYKMLDLIEAISRATAGVTIFYIDGDQQLSDIANSFQKVFPAICPTSTYKKTYEFDKIIRKSEPLDIETIYELNSVNAAYEFYYFYFSYRLIRFPTNQICSLDVSRDLQCINTLMEELRFDNDSEDSFKYLIIKMMIYGQIIVLLDTIIDSFDDYKHINVWFKPLNKRFDIQLGEDHMKEYLEAWKRKLQATTVKDVISMLEQDGEIHIPKEEENNSAQFKDVQGHPFSSLIRIIVSILETKLFPILPIIAQDYFTSSQGLLTNSQNMNPSGSFFQLNSWSYETISSRKITVFEYTGGKIIDTHFFDGKEGETGIKMIQNKNNERLKQTSEMVFKFISELKPKLNQKDISDKIHNYFYFCLFGSNLPLENDVNSHCQDGFIHMMSNNQRTNFEKFTLVEEINKNCQNDALNDCIEHLKIFLKHRSKICAIELPGGVRGLSRDVLDHVQKFNKIVRGFQKVLLIFNGCKEDTSKIT
ncbi:uncharacterized protein LOC136037715 isoform X1 [Artemia franciscana]|uniref:uncharacterized protein LOC136037715 isoform X1 n=1 Tax=Artemia franciscana TaxID=6661 RepID=UPI0032DA9295